MVKYLEELLLEKTKGTQSEILFAQWSYDKKVVPAALHAVSVLFPHYSLHDETHSITIVNNIVRVIGKENISRLSAIDIWLILEASYCHDIGMVVSSEKMAETLNSASFIAFFKELIDDKKNGLHEFAAQFQIIDNQIKYKTEVLNLELNDGLKFVLAEYFRRIHAERSKEIINNPLSELSLLSPRGVIAPRIFKILGDICSSHTKDFTDVMSLPFCEVGVDVEDAHPRFIACLLRIGDLLDLDNNRFSEVMLRTLSRVPIDTLNHKAKHLSIEYFRVDRDRIEITANCKDYDSAAITQHWFNYLNSEITKQMINWNNIVPTKDLCYLPTIGSLKVELSNYDLIDGKNKPKFTVDTDKALSLLQGAGIYDGAYQCIREVLQNSVDATLIRIWLEHKGGKDFETPMSKDFLEIAKDYPIEIDINKKGKDRDFQNWEIQIRDKGVGISTNDLKFLMATGSSSKNRTKMNVVDEMPVWMKPSGTFGIGFQSIFMLSDVVTIETKNFFDEDFQIVELNSPNSIKGGDILIQKKKTTHAIKPGTKITLIHKTKAIPERYSINSEHRNADRIAKNFDPFLHETMDVEIGRVVDEVCAFAEKSSLPLILNVDGQNVVTNLNSGGKFKYYDAESAMEMNVSCKGERRQRENFRVYYKGQEAEINYDTLFLSFEVNIHKENASEVLTLNRNKIKSDYRRKFEKIFEQASLRVIVNNFHEIFKDISQQPIGSMFLNYGESREEFKAFDLTKFNQWEDFEVNVGSSPVKLKNIFTGKDFLKLIYNHKFGGALPYDEYKFNDSEIQICFNGTSPSLDYTRFVLHKAKVHFSAVKVLRGASDRIEGLLFSKDNQAPIVESDKELLMIIRKLRSNTYLHTARVIMPCSVDFLVLRIKDGAFKPYLYHYIIDNNISIPYPEMLSPFVREDNGNGECMLNWSLNENIVNWIYENRYDANTTRKQIEDGYEVLRQRVDLSEINKS